MNDRHYSDTGECAWYSECKGSYSVYYIDLTLLFVLIRHFKREFLLAMFNDMFDCDEVSYCFFLLQSLSIHSIGSVYLHNSESVFQNSNN